MRTILIPVDFTPSSDNATGFAAGWAGEFSYEHIILLRTISNSVFRVILPSQEQADNYNLYLEREKAHLHESSKLVKEFVGPGIKVSFMLSEEPLLRSVLNLIAAEQVDLVIVPGENAKVIEIAKSSPVRVLILPPGSVYKPVKNILVPFDFKSFESLEKISRYMPQAAKSTERDIIVLNVDPENKHLADELFVNRENSLHEYLRDFRHEIFFSEQSDVLEGILKFINTHPVDLVVALPGKHSFLYTLTHESISKALYLKAPKPVLILK